MQVLVVEDDWLIRGGIVQEIGRIQPGAVVLQADSLQQTFASLEAAPETDLIILDLELLDSSGVDTLKRVRERCERCGVAPRIVVLSASTEQELVVDVLTNYSTGYIVKGVGADEFADALATTLKGRIYMPAQVLKFLLPMADSPSRLVPSPQGAYPSTLTEREREICGLLAAGLTYKEIARKLARSGGRVPAENTIRVHVNNIAQKFGVTKNVKAGVMAALARYGIVGANGPDA